MKRMFVLLFLSLLLTFGPSVRAAEEDFDVPELGMEFDLLGFGKDSQYGAFLTWPDILQRGPFVAVSKMYYSVITKDVKSALYQAMATLSPADQVVVNTFIDHPFYERIVGYVVATDAADLAKAMEEAGMPLPEDAEITELHADGEWHQYLVLLPVEGFMNEYASLRGDVAEDPMDTQAEIGKIRADMERLRSELLERTTSARFYTPQDILEGVTDAPIQFEFTDLEGNPVSSADLFRENKITMVNVWGVWCHNCVNEMPELAKIHECLQEKGCGIVGVELEFESMEDIKDRAYEILDGCGVTYPNVFVPEDDDFYMNLGEYPCTFFVDSEGTILTDPVVGNHTELYEAVIDVLLAGMGESN